MRPVQIGKSSKGHPARLYVFEGVDRIKRAAVAEAFAQALTQRGINCIYLSCQKGPAPILNDAPLTVKGRKSRQSAVSAEPIIEQLVDAFSRIKCAVKDAAPALASSTCVVTDSFWWSTVVDGQARGVPTRLLNRLSELERTFWDEQASPHAIFVLSAAEPKQGGVARLGQGGVNRGYKSLAEDNGTIYSVRHLDDGYSPEELAAKALLLAPEALLRVAPSEMPLVLKQPEQHSVEQLGFTFTPKLAPKSAPRSLTQCLPQALRPTPVFETYWRFAAERQEVFFGRLEGTPPPWTDDPILLEYRFTNAYRAADRVSQYLIRNVTYRGEQTAENIFFRTLLFKFFNKIETWKLLEAEVGEVSLANYDFDRYERVLSGAMERGERIYSAAYVMPAASGFDHHRKHGTHLRLLEHLMKERVPLRMQEARNLRTAFEILRSYPMMGDFLAYQYVTDLNYSAAYDFEEDFIVPGPGARDGIRKCFGDLGGITESQVIEHVTRIQDDAFEALGLRFRSLWGRKLHLIDCQNLFCEVDKYSRVAHPEVQGISGRTRIKQHYRHDPRQIDYWFPPKWGLNERIEKESSPGSSKQRTQALG
ncbi:nucleotide kinase domain-containing protein [Corallococcus sp. 4LFB]|uniref:nucleotide kinase domain-containing protein n=1 Tax=Corallococcus sp. 4LFB TaxID=3383249 RepID=UPI00397715FD